MLTSQTLITDRPTGLSAVHITNTIIRVYWTPSTGTLTGYEITYFAGAGDTTGTAVPVGGGSTSSTEIPNLSATVIYRVSIASVNGDTHSDPPTGPVLAARGTGACTCFIVRWIFWSHTYDCIVGYFQGCKFSWIAWPCTEFTIIWWPLQAVYMMHQKTKLTFYGEGSSTGRSSCLWLAIQWSMLCSEVWWLLRPIAGSIHDSRTNQTLTQIRGGSSRGPGAPLTSYNKIYAHACAVSSALLTFDLHLVEYMYLVTIEYGKGWETER